MRWYERKNGISVLIACQNEEALISLCIRSFLEFGDELIVVDNGSIDRSKEIVRSLQAQYPEKIKFFDVPELPDLYHNRQYAFEQSSYRWIVRADSDFVAYTDGEYDIRQFREFLLAQKRLPIPKVYGAPLPNVTGDFWHTGLNHVDGKRSPNDPGRYVPRPVTSAHMRVYEVFPRFRFQRLGRWEGIRFNRFIRKISVMLDRPLWMHCNLKTTRSYLFRSERTNWRELGDYATYPTLESYLRTVVLQKYGTEDLDEAAQIYLRESIYPFLQPYDPEKYFAYPKLVIEQMTDNPIYKIIKRAGRMQREDYFVNV